ncbi:MAG: hypothetical protein H0T51_10820, partial [Pirellulales bacterium]|nr:hypothetical protein [Pirellulales bacterium]
MTEPRLSTRRELELMQHLQQLADRRARDEQVIAAGLAGALSAATKDFEETSQRFNEEHSQRRRLLENAYAEAIQSAATAFESGMAEAEATRRDTQKAIENKRGSVAVGANHFVKEAEWQALSIYDAAKNKPFELIEEATLRIQSRRRQVDGLERDARTLLEMRGLTKAAEAYDWRAATSEAAAEEAATKPAPTSNEEKLQQALVELHQSVLELQDQRLPSLFLEGGRKWAWFAGIAIVTTLIGGAAGGGVSLYA